MPTMDSSDMPRLIASITDQVLGVASDVLSVPMARLTPDTSPGDVEAWDSVRHLLLTMAVEQQFAVRFTPDDIDQARSLRQLAAAVQRHLETRSPD